VLCVVGAVLLLGAGPARAQPGGWRSHIHIGPEDPNLTGGPSSSFNTWVPPDYGPYPPEWYHWPTLREALDRYGWFGHHMRDGHPREPAGGMTPPVPPKAPAASPAAAATIRVLVPAGAEVWFDDVPTAQGGTQRLFVTPPLGEGQTYPYEVRARWGSAGAEMNRTRTIHVAAGDRLTVDLRTAGPDAEVETLHAPSPVSPSR
jgi:uncharacterized protein (TIGR03000 family)